MTPELEDDTAPDKTEIDAVDTGGGSLLIAGSRIRHYELIRELGKGGMARVFLARDLKLGRRVAIKFMMLSSVDAGIRFVNEARATAVCRHENIVVIHDVDAIDAIPYMVLEYLEGKSLTASIREGPIPTPRALEIIVPILRALVCAHAHGIVHRDLKPSNIMVTSSGAVKVLDFGIAKVLGGKADETPRPDPNDAAASQVDRMYTSDLTRDGVHIGTPATMSPEQCSGEGVDHRTDIWAVGIILYEMLAGRHPLDRVNMASVRWASLALDEPLPGVATHAAHVPRALAQIVDRCLEKRKEKRWPTAQALLGELEPLLPTHIGRALREGESPFPGLSSFQEADADRFFGRRRETRQMVARLQDQPLVAVVGPSGVGKSSFVRAGVVPALKSSGDEWEVLAFRPGKQPLAALAALLRSSVALSRSIDVERRLRTEPGFLGAQLRENAKTQGARILLFVDQFEELYTLVADRAERAALTSALAAMADDASAPVRVVISMRSDFIDRVAEDRRFLDEVLRGLSLLSPPDREALREALLSPLEMVGYGFEDDAIADDMLDALESTAGALPLLQFTAARLWDTRDDRAHLLTQRSYEQIGGIAGALAAHADEVIAGLTPSMQQIAKALFQRLVTPERTRALVDIDELSHLSQNKDEVLKVIDYLVGARLLVIQKHGDEKGASVELVHESMITSWPTLHRWLDVIQEGAAFLSQLRVAAKQWEQMGRPEGMLWTGESVEEARRWIKRADQSLAERESQFLSSVLALSDRAVRIKRSLLIGTIAFLIALVGAAAIALFWIRNAERVAVAEAERARKAEVLSHEQLELLKAKERERQEAMKEVSQANVEIESKTEALNVTNAKLGEALQESKSSAKKLAAANTELERILQKERARIKELEREKKKIITELK